MNHLALRASRAVPVDVQQAMARGAPGFCSAHQGPGGCWEVRRHASCPDASTLVAADRRYAELAEPGRVLPALVFQVWVVERLLDHPAKQPLLAIAHATC